MCGVVAALGHPDISEPLRRLAHRGIRSSVKECVYGVIGHVRLPIVGLADVHDQPVKNGNWLIGFVGEILDFQDTHHYAECDTDVLVDLWTTKGQECLNDRDGFWGVVAIHDKMGLLHVRTDYLGQKPMYYRVDFPSAASEPDALLPFGPVTLDHVYLSACVKWGYCPDLTRTPYCEIKHVLPGEHVVLSTHGGVSRRIVDPLTSEGMVSTSAIRKEIELAVQRRVLSSDVPVASLVSGGVDSAIVHVLASRHANIVPYYVQERDDSEDDYRKAMRVVHGSSKVHNLIGEPEEKILCKSLHRSFYDHVPVGHALRVMQEPIDLGSLRPQIALSHAVIERVCLTGDGADEVFGGYGRYMRYDAQHSDLFQEIPAWHAPRLDRVMMSRMIEVRTPFLARKVVRLAMGLPHELRKNKRFLRSIFSDILPPDIVGAEKKALRTPEIARDREYYSKVLVDMFVRNFRDQPNAS